jgi:hypothetical protein
VVIDKAELRSMSRAERHELAALLAELDEPAGANEPANTAESAATPSQSEPVRPEPVRPEPARPEPARPEPVSPGSVRPDPFRIDPVLARERRLALLVSAGCCVALAGWIVLLAATLPHHFDAHHWRALWVNFDVFLFAAFAATAWAIWRQRQVLILLLVLIGTMLCCDAWFDVGTSLATNGFWISLLSALGAELPLAALAFLGARRLLRATVAAGILAGARAQAAHAAAAGHPAAANAVGPQSPAAANAVGPQSPAAAKQSPDALDWARVGNWGRSCAGQSLRRAPLSGNGLGEALPRSRAERRADRARQAGHAGQAA